MTTTMENDTKKKYRKDYYERNKDRIRVTQKAYRDANPELVRAANVAWRMANEGHTYGPPGEYVKYIGFEHPASNPSGLTAYHRIILWDKLGGSDAPCNWCGKQLFWSHTFPEHDALITDHVNTVKDDNRPENLVPSCARCNTSRPGGHNRVLQSDSDCSLAFCDRSANTKGLCRVHYNQQWRGVPLTPIRPHKRPRPGTVTDDGRECNTCGEFKTWENYYFRTNGVPHAHCKPCVVEKTVEYRDARLAKNIECSMAGCTAPVNMKNLCTAHYHSDWYAKKTDNEKSNR